MVEEVHDVSTTFVQIEAFILFQSFLIFIKYSLDICTHDHRSHLPNLLDSTLHGLLLEGNSNRIRISSNCVKLIFWKDHSTYISMIFVKYCDSLFLYVLFQSNCTLPEEVQPSSGHWKSTSVVYMTMFTGTCTCAVYKCTQ